MDAPSTSGQAYTGDGGKTEKGAQQNGHIVPPIKLFQRRAARDTSMRRLGNRAPLWWRAR